MGEHYFKGEAMNEGRYYLSDQDLNDRLAEMPGNPNVGAACYDYPPCGGCDGCITAMQTHYFLKEREWARRVHTAGLELANPRVIDTQEISRHVHKSGGWGECHGEGGYHCWVAKEIDNCIFPWNRRG